MAGGLIALAVALLAAAAFGVVWRRRSGRFHQVRGAGERGAAAPGTAQPGPAAPGSGQQGPAPGSAQPGVERLTSADLGVPLGERATLVQFSTAFCAPCRPTRQVLAQVAGMVDGVRHVEVDAVARLDLAGRLRIVSTPTVLVLDSRGTVAARAAGMPRKADVIAVLGNVIQPERHLGSDSRSESE